MTYHNLVGVLSPTGLKDGGFYQGFFRCRTAICWTSFHWMDRLPRQAHLKGTGARIIGALWLFFFLWVVPHFWGHLKLICHDVPEVNKWCFQILFKCAIYWMISLYVLPRSWCPWAKPCLWALKVEVVSNEWFNVVNPPTNHAPPSILPPIWRVVHVWEKVGWMIGNTE